MSAILRVALRLALLTLGLLFLGSKAAGAAEPRALADTGLDAQVPVVLGVMMTGAGALLLPLRRRR